MCFISLVKNWNGYVCLFSGIGWFIQVLKLAPLKCCLKSWNGGEGSAKSWNPGVLQKPGIQGFCKIHSAVTAIKIFRAQTT